MMTTFIAPSLAASVLLTYFGISENTFLSKHIKLNSMQRVYATVTEVMMVTFGIGFTTKVPMASIACMWVTGLAIVVIGVCLADAADKKKLRPVPARASVHRGSRR